MIKLNIACGDNPISDAINCDLNIHLKPDVVLNVKQGIPFKDESVDLIIFSHAIEHIEEKLHEALLKEFRRVLKPEGKLFISYPEFIKIAKNYIENVHGNREFWKMTIYGGQCYPGDYHVSLMNTESFVEFLKEVGFTNINYQEEPSQIFNTMLLCQKGEPMLSYEDVLRQEIFG